MIWLTSDHVNNICEYWNIKSTFCIPKIKASRNKFIIKFVNYSKLYHTCSFVKFRFCQLNSSAEYRLTPPNVPDGFNWLMRLWTTKTLEELSLFRVFKQRLIIVANHLGIVPCAQPIAMTGKRSKLELISTIPLIIIIIIMYKLYSEPKCAECAVLLPFVEWLKQLKCGFASTCLRILVQFA